MPDVHCPVFIAHGRKDSMVPFEHGRKLFEAAAEPKQFVELGGDHNDGTIEADRAYRTTVMEFMAKHIIRKE
jgi:fermentation-respiration switch protein FrsA (DUF1100 family)